MMKTNKNNSYNEFLYESSILDETDPASLASRAYLFGLNSPNVNNARILELGCGGAENIIAIANKYPSSYCVGVDSSDVQISLAREKISQQNISNLKLEAKSILEIDKSFGQFDYIICHGVFSWVDEITRQKTLEICNENLSENGVVYMSYNTLPGWSNSNAIREMMLYHTEGFEDATSKVEQSLELLNFLKKTLKSYNKNYYQEIIDNELNYLKSQPDWYIFHEYLEKNNSQFYFSDFIKICEGQNLQYLCESNLATMNVVNFPEEASKILSQIDDIIRVEQYIDYITNRRFRSTLLCKKQNKLVRDLSKIDISDKYFLPNFQLPEQLKDNSYKIGDAIIFTFPNGIRTSFDNFYLIYAFEYLAKNSGKPSNIVEIIKYINSKIEFVEDVKKPNQADLKSLLLNNFLITIFSGGIELIII